MNRLGQWGMIRIALFTFLAGMITVATQFYVGNATIYGDDAATRRSEYHEAILTNTPPHGGTWKDVSAQTLNVRVGVVYLAEGIHRVTGLSVARTYLMIDTVFLFATILGLGSYLRLFVRDELALIGVLYFACVLPLTYLLHIFHPWDRPQLFLWLLMLYVIRSNQPFVLLIPLLVISIIVKFDSVLFPLFYLLLKARRDHLKTTIEGVVLALFALATYFVLKNTFPNPPNEPARFTLSVTLHQFTENLRNVASQPLTYPPIVAFAIPSLLALMRLRLRNRFDVASIVFALILWTVAFLTTRAAEVRAEMVILLLLMPAALMQLEQIMSGNPRAERIGSRG